jgi:hypothetical protein
VIEDLFEANGWGDRYLERRHLRLRTLPLQNP